MRVDGRRYRDEWLPNTYPGKRLPNGVMRISRCGEPIFLTVEEDAQFDEFFMEDQLFKRLEETGHIVTQVNSTKVFAKLQTWLSGTYDGPGLHIVVPTKRCNLNCTYCHMYPQPMSSDVATTDLDSSTIKYIAKFIMSSPRPALSIEFQGGEPFLHFSAIIETVEEVRRLNETAQKRIDFGVVSNLMVAKDEQLAFCFANNIRVSYSLNGPQEHHDLVRITRSGSGSHSAVIKKIDHINQTFPGLLARYPLCVVTQDNMAHLSSLADYYFGLGFTELGMILLKNLGNARGRVSFDIKAFIPHYIALLNSIYDNNKVSGNPCRTERLVKLALTKIFSDTNPLFIDWRNPIGYFSNSIVYDFDGEILPVDEARSLRNRFSLGNVKDVTYEELLHKKSTFETINASIRDQNPTCRECSYNPYCGVSPVLNYAKTGELLPRPHENDECILVIAIFDWVFHKLTEEDMVPLLKMVPDYMTSILQQLRSGTRSPTIPEQSLIC